MGRISVAAFRPKPAKENDLLQVIADRLPLLRRLDFATDRTPILMRSRDGVLIQVSEWSSDEAVAKAHETPEVLAMRDRFAACSDYVKLDGLAEVHEDFATFEAVD